MAPDSANQQYHSGKRKEVKAKQMRKKGLIGLGNLKKKSKDEKKLVLNDQVSNSEKN